MRNGSRYEEIYCAGTVVNLKITLILTGFWGFAPQNPKTPQKVNIIIKILEARQSLFFKLERVI